MGTFLPFAPPCRGNVPPSFASLSTEEPVSTAAMNDGGGGEGGPTVFQIRRIDGSFESGGGIGVHLVTRMHREKLFNERTWIVCARLVCVRTHTLVVGSRRIPTRRASSCFLYRRAFFTANERVFGALITPAFYIIHGMEEDREQSIVDYENDDGGIEGFRLFIGERERKNFNMICSYIYRRRVRFVAYIFLFVSIVTF